METTESPAGAQHSPLEIAREGMIAMLESFVAEQGISDPNSLHTLRDVATRTHDERAGLRGARGFEQAADLTASRIHLVEEADLEFSLDLDQLVRDVKDATEATLGKVHLRYLTMLGVDDDSLTETPVGPETVCAVLRAIAEAQDLSAQERGLLLLSWRKPLVEHLRAFYRSLDKQLDALGVKPAALSIFNKGVPNRYIHDSSTGVGALRNALARRPGNRGGFDDSDETYSSAAANKVIGSLRNLLFNNARQHGEDPLALLSSEQFHMLAPEMADSVELIERLFIQLAGDSHLPQAARDLLIKLRAPLLDTAFASEDLLADPGGPVERFIDIFSAVANTLPYRDATHPGYHTLEGIITELLASGRPTRRTLEHASMACEAFLARRRTAAKQLAEPAIAFAEKAERRETARLFGSRAIQMLLEGGQCSTAHNFLIRHWVHVLTNTLYRKGDRHPDWRAQLRLANDISLLDNPDNSMQDGLRQNVLAMLGQAGLSAAAIARATEDFDAIAGATGNAPMPVITSPLSLSVASGNRSLILLHHHGFALDSERSGGPTLPDRHDWLDLILPNNEALTGCVQWVGAAQRAVLVADPDKKLCVIMTRRAIGELETAVRLERRATRGVFERNARAALSRLMSDRA